MWSVVRLRFTFMGSTEVMSEVTWSQARRTALVLSCVTFFAAITVIGQVAPPDPLPEPPDRQLVARF